MAIKAAEKAIEKGEAAAAAGEEELVATAVTLKTAKEVRQRVRTSERVGRRTAAAAVAVCVRGIDSPPPL